MEKLHFCLLISVPTTCLEPTQEPRAWVLLASAPSAPVIWGCTVLHVHEEGTEKTYLHISRASGKICLCCLDISQLLGRAHMTVVRVTTEPNFISLEKRPRTFS